MTDQLPEVFRGAPTDEQIRAFEQVLAAMPQHECEVDHHFADGVYGRIAHLPAGFTCTGKRHRFSTLNILLKGRIQITGADGVVRVFEAPAVYTTPPGCKKVAHALTDVMWMNVHATKLTDVAAIEQKFIEPEAPAIAHKERPCLG